MCICDAKISSKCIKRANGILIVFDLIYRMESVKAQSIKRVIYRFTCTEKEERDLCMTEKFSILYIKEQYPYTPPTSKICPGDLYGASFYCPARFSPDR